MKNILLKALQYIVISIFVSFLIYLINPLFPGLSELFVRAAKGINGFLNMEINPKNLAIILALAVFLVVFLVLTQLAVLFRKRAGVEWSAINPMVRYASVSFSVLKTIILILTLPLIYGYARALYDTCRAISFSNNRVLAFSVGFAGWSFLWLLCWEKWGFFSILEHEITHMIVGMCFLHKPQKLVVVENEGGWVQLAGRNFVITLAPYFMLTLCFLMLPLFLVIQPGFYLPYFFIMGLFAAYHTLSTIRETRFNNQPDIIFTGKIFSLFIIILGNVFCYGFILAFVQTGFGGGRGFISEGWNYSIDAIKLIIKSVLG